MSDELLVSYLLNEADNGARQQVEQWIIESPANRKYFDHFSLIWETSRQMEIPAHINEEDAWQRFSERIAAPPQKNAVVKNVNNYFARFKMAAVIIVCVGLMTLSYLVWDKITSAPVTFASLEVSTTQTLPDGSVVTLNKNSQISYSGKLKGDKRKIKLKGEAFFKVTANKTKPFVVEVNDVMVTVLGTSFNVKSSNGNTEVVVETGMVQVTKNNNTVILKPGEKVFMQQKDSVIVKEETEDKLYNYYLTKEFICDNTPLWKLVEVLNEAYGSTIIIENRQLMNLPLTSTFYNESLDNILSVIGETFNITVERQGDTIILK